MVNINQASVARNETKHKQMTKCLPLSWAADDIKWNEVPKVHNANILYFIARKCY